MRKVCDMCGGAGRRAVYNTAGQSVTYATEPCPMCGGHGYVEDVIEPTNRELTEYALDKFREVDMLRKRLDKIVQFAEKRCSRETAWEIWRISAGGKDGDDT
jgi:RecJ-like exonuclease